MAWLVLTCLIIRFSRDSRSDSPADMIPCGCFTFLRSQLVRRGRNEKNYSIWILIMISIHEATVNGAPMFVLRIDCFTRRQNCIRMGIVERTCPWHTRGTACARRVRKRPSRFIALKYRPRNHDDHADVIRDRMHVYQSYGTESRSRRKSSRNNDRC